MPATALATGLPNPLLLEPFVIRTPHLLTLTLAVATALSACKKSEDAAPAAPAADTAATTPAAPKTLTLDQSKLPAVNQFTAADLDANGNACTDLNAYANAKFLAANPVPSDRTSWGAFEMLDERSNAIQQQLVEQAAADTSASGVERLSATCGPPAWTKPRSTPRVSSR